MSAFGRSDHRRAYLSTGLGDSTKIVDHVYLRHTDTSITNTEEPLLLVDADTDVELFLSVKDGRIGQ